MNAMLWILRFDDLLYLMIIGFFLFLRQRPYAILAAMLLAPILLANIVVLRGFSSWFIVVAPLFLASAIILIARPFLPRPRVTMGVRTSRIAVVFSLVVVLAFVIFSVIFIFFYRR